MSCANPQKRTDHSNAIPHVPIVPPATQAKLAHPAAPGQRHTQIVQIAAALIGQGFNAEAVFWQIRPNYGPDVFDNEIRSVIAWAVCHITANGIRFSGTVSFPKKRTDYATENGKRPFSHPFFDSPKTLQNAQSPVFGGGFGCRKNAIHPFSPFPVSRNGTVLATPKTPVSPFPLPKRLTENAVIAPEDATVTDTVSVDEKPQNGPIPKPLSGPKSPIISAPLTVNIALQSHIYGKPLPQITISETTHARITAKRAETATRNRSVTASRTAIEIDSVTAIERFLDGFRCDECDLWECSQIRPAENWENDAVTVIATLFSSGENVNIVSRFAVNDGKARPHGYGITQTRETWLAEIARKGPPKSAAGVWIRPNPTDGNGISDANVRAYRFLLIEFDAIPLPLQIAFIARLSLPIAAIITSGGKSLHAWVAINAANATDYRTLASRIFSALEPFGVDTANKNPARLSRLPGVTREIGTVRDTDNRQRLLYLNPEPKTERIIA